MTFKDRVNKIISKNDIILERVNPGTGENATNSQVKGGYKSWASRLEKLGVIKSPEDIEDWFDRNEDRLKEIEKKIKRDPKTRNVPARYWATVSALMSRDFGIKITSKRKGN